MGYTSLMPSLEGNLNNLNKLKRNFTNFVTHQPKGTFLLKCVKFAFEVYLSLCSVDVIMTPSKMPFYYIRGKQESPANAKGTRDSSACMKARCEQT